jgi:hypothetical protein
MIAETMHLIRLNDGRIVEVLREVSEAFLRSLGKERCQEYLAKLEVRGADVVVKNQAGNFLIGRGCVDVDDLPDTAVEQIEEPVQKKKRGRPKGSKNKPKEE